MRPGKELIASARPTRLIFAATILTLFGLLVSLQALPAGAARERVQTLDVCGERGTLHAARLPARIPADTCDLVGRYIESGDVRLQVPPPGKAVGAAAVGMTSESELVITTEEDGDVLVGDEAGSSAAGAATEPCDKYGFIGCLPPCTDPNYHTYTPYNAKVENKQPWFFKAASTPRMMTKRQALAHIKAGTKNVVSGRNNCTPDLGDPVAETAPYKGRTRKGTGISVAGSGSSATNQCGRANAKNVVDFGALTNPTLGLACWRMISRDGVQWFIAEADIRLKKSGPWTLTPDKSSCSNRYDMQGVMTHERGHAFGLAHADNVAAHRQLTMYPSTFPCSSYARTLGLGDHSGLSFLYAPEPT